MCESDNATVRYISMKGLADHSSIIGSNLEYLGDIYSLSQDNILHLMGMYMHRYSQEELSTIEAIEDTAQDKVELKTLE